MEQQNTAHRFSFDGKGGTLFGLMLANAVLILITLGVYQFWARVRMRRFFYQHTRFMEQPFDYHGTGWEIFTGFLKFMGLCIGYGIIIYLAGSFTQKAGGGMYAGIIITVVVFLSIIALIPLFVAGGIRYRLGRSSWNGVRFSFAAKPAEFTALMLKGLLLYIITLGIYGPWLYYDVRRYIIVNSAYGRSSFEFDGDRGEFVRMLWTGILLTIITFGFYYYWLSARMHRYFWGHTLLKGKRFASNLDGGDLFGYTMLLFMLAFFTLGIGLPWGIVMRQKLLTGSLSIEEGLDLAAIKADYDQHASTMPDSLDGVYGFFDSAGSMFG